MKASLAFPIHFLKIYSSTRAGLEQLHADLC